MFCEQMRSKVFKTAVKVCLFLYHKVSNCKLSNALQRMPDWFHNDLLGIYRLPQIKIISFGKCHLTIEGITFFLSVAPKICNSVKTIHGLSSKIDHSLLHTFALSPSNTIFRESLQKISYLRCFTYL